MSQTSALVLTVGGGAILAVGVTAVYWPLGLILVGAVMVAAGLFMETK